MPTEQPRDDNDLRDPHGELTLMAYVLIFKRHWRRIVVASVSLAVICYGLSFLFPPDYKANTTLIPVGSEDQSSGLAVLGVDFRSLGLGLAGGGVTPIMYPEIATSREVLGRVLNIVVTPRGSKQAVMLREWLNPPGEGRRRDESALRMLSQRVDVSVNRRTDIISLECRDNDPVVAAQIANAVADTLQEFLIHIQTSHAGEKRRFIENRLQEIQDDLERAEDRLRAFREDNLRIGNSPRLTLQESRLSRAVREQEEIYLTVRREGELAKIEENRDVPVLATLDRASPPIRRYWPMRSLFAAVGLLLGMGAVVAHSALLQGAPGPIRR